MIHPDWEPTGRTARTSYFRVSERILAAWPDERCIDDEVSALENNQFQRHYFEQLGKTGVVVIFFDRIASQDRGARTVYARRTSPDWAAGIALIGGTMLTRALGSFFMGLSQPAVPTRMFPDLATAMPWIDARLAEDDRA